MSSDPAAGAVALVLAPDVVIRPRSGRFQIAAGGGVFETDQPALVAWLLQFARPTEKDALLRTMPAGDRAPAAELISHLRRIGVLVEASVARADPDSEHQSAKQRMAAIAQGVYDLACDLRGLGPAAYGEESSIGARLDSLRGGLGALREDLAMLRQPHLDHQLAALGVTSQSRDLKLHIGAGGHDLAGWVNIDVHPAPLAMNLAWGLPFCDGQARFVFLSHLLEHLFYPQQALQLLGEIRRVLSPGGIARIVVPDIEQCLQAYVRNDREFFDRRREIWTWWPQDQTRLEDFLAYAGAGPAPAQLFESHKFGYDFETLSKALARAGFQSIRRCGFLQSPHPELQVDSASFAAGARHGEQHYSLFVEAS